MGRERKEGEGRRRGTRGGTKDKDEKGGGEGRKEGCTPETDDESNDNLH